MSNLIPVTYLGKQSGFNIVTDFYLVNMQDGRTVKYHPELHKIVGIDKRSREKEVPENLRERG